MTIRAESESPLERKLADPEHGTREPGSDARLPSGFRTAAALSVVASLLTASHYGREDGRPEGPAPQIVPPPPVSRWLLEPERPPFSIVTIKTRYVTVRFDEGRVSEGAEWEQSPDAGPREITLTVSGTYEGGPIQLAVDAGGERTYIRPSARSGSESCHFTLPSEIVPSDITGIGVLYVPPSRSAAYAEASYRAGVASGVPVFPRAVVDESWENWMIVTDGGKVLSAEELGGRTLIVDYWATYCRVCTKYVTPMLAEFARENPDVVLVGVNLSSAAEQSAGASHPEEFPAGFLEVTLPYGTEGYYLHIGALTGDSDLTGIPYIVIVNGSGVVTYAGNFTGEEALRAALAR